MKWNQFLKTNCLSDTVDGMFENTLSRNHDTIGI